MSLSFFHHYLQSQALYYTHFKHKLRLMGYHPLLCLVLSIGVASLTPSTSVPLPKTEKVMGQSIVATGVSSPIYFLSSQAALTSTGTVEVLSGDQCQSVYVSPAIAKGSYLQIPINFTEIAGSAWLTELMSFSYDRAQQIVYAFLDNGTLLKVPNFTFSARSASLLKAISYNRSSKTGESWFNEHNELIWFSGSLFVLASEKLSKIQLQKEGYWTQNEPLEQGVVTVKIQAELMYILTRTELKTYTSSGQLKTIKSGGTKFQDFLILNRYLYLLDVYKGLLQLPLDASPSTELIWQLQQLPSAIKLRGHGTTLLILYQYQRRSYIAEYYLIDNKLYLNRYYHNYDRIKDIYMTNNYAIIDSYSQWILMHHSINRHSFSRFNTTDFIYKSKSTKVNGIYLLNNQENLTFIVALKNKIEQLTFMSLKPSNNHSTSFGINSLTVVCKSDPREVQRYPIRQIGPCSAAQYNPINYICDVQFPVSISFDSTLASKSDQKKHSRFIVWLVIILFTIFSTIGCVYCRRKLNQIQSKIKSDFERLQQKKQQHSINMEKTFNAQIAA